MIPVAARNDCEAVGLGEISMSNLTASRVIPKQNKKGRSLP
jgi:hypothetical protein